MRSRAPWIAIVIVVAGCEAVPELAFEEADGGDPSSSALGSPDGEATSVDAAKARDATSPSNLDASPATADSGVSHADAGHDSGVDAGVDAGATGCPSKAPAGAGGCCGAIACVGPKCDMHCNECVGCTGQFCCISGGMGHGPTCASSVAACGP